MKSRDDYEDDYDNEDEDYEWYGFHEVQPDPQSFEWLDTLEPNIESSIVNFANALAGVTYGHNCNYRQNNRLQQWYDNEENDHLYIITQYLKKTINYFKDKPEEIYIAIEIVIEKVLVHLPTIFDTGDTLLDSLGLTPEEINEYFEDYGKFRQKLIAKYGNVKKE